MSGHTPGPWDLEANGEGVLADNHLIALVCGENYGQWRDAEDGGRAEFEANAKLIAAAPELLEALRPFLDIGPQKSAWGVISKKLDGLAPLTVTVTKAQMLAAFAAVTKATEA